MNIQQEQQKKRRRRRMRQLGMTLIEIMVVVVIIGLISTVVGVALIRNLEEGKVGTARTQVCNLKAALTAYRIKKGRYPTNAEGLQALITSGNLAAKKLPKDPWGHDYFYRFPSPTNPDEPDVLSYGADGKEGGTEYNTKDIRCEQDN